MLLKGAVLMPDIAIDDPAFTLTAPKSVTAATGLDALCHASEAYTSRKSQPLTDEFAISAIKKIFKYLRFVIMTAVMLMQGHKCHLQHLKQV